MTSQYIFFKTTTEKDIDVMWTKDVKHLINKQYMQMTELWAYLYTPLSILFKSSLNVL